MSKFSNFTKNSVKVIFLADIVGKIGRKAVKKYLPELKKQYRPDLIIANAENLAHGIGFTKKTIDEMAVLGVDCFTSGNHAWGKNGADEILNQNNPAVIRPANYRLKKSGVGVKELKIGSNKIIVINLLGEVFINEKLFSPFKVLASIIKSYAGKPIFIVDFHAEATSEKRALAASFDGQVAAVIGTHTHAPTGDEKILAEGTAFITDAGMIGYEDSVIGANKEYIINSFFGKKGKAKKHDLPDKGKCQFDAVYLEIDVKTRRAKKIKRLNKILNIK